MANELAPVGNKGNAEALMRGLMPKVKDLLPKHLTPERMMRVGLNALVRNPKLMQCSTLSVCNAIVTCSEFGLEPNTPLGLAHIIPYGNVATFQIGYPGLLELAHRSGRVEFDVPQTVFEKDHFEYKLGLRPDLIHVPIDGDRGVAVGYYAVARVTGSETPKFVYMSKADVEAHARRFSKAYAQKGGPWETNFDAMAKKTAMIGLCKWLPRSIEGALEKAIAIDTAADQGIDPRSMGLDPIDVDVDARNVSQADALAERIQTKRGPGRPPKSANPAAAEFQESPENLQAAIDRKAQAQVEPQIAAPRIDEPQSRMEYLWGLAEIMCEKHAVSLDHFKDWLREHEYVPEDLTELELEGAIDMLEREYGAHERL